MRYRLKVKEVEACQWDGEFKIPHIYSRRECVWFIDSTGNFKRLTPELGMDSMFSKIMACFQTDPCGKIGLVNSGNFKSSEEMLLELTVELVGGSITAPDVYRWIGEFYARGVKYFVDTSVGPVEIKAGDWLVAEGGKLSVLKDADFLAMFEPSPTEDDK